jgi:mono/diheme cytochrome c family protein
MKKITAIFILLFATLLSVNAEEVAGQTIYDNKCASCHTLKMPDDKSTMKAPPMSRVSAKVKHAFDDNKTAFIEFVADYIESPTKEKAKCMTRAIKNFGIMPAIGKAMTKEERNTIATWLFDNFDEKWETKDCKGGDCAGKTKESKCASGKCASKKCGNDKSKTEMKCASGKCGGK